MRIYGLLVLLIGITGCAALNQPISEMTASRLTCESNPEFVDGNLETDGTFAVNGFVRKAYYLNEGEGRRLAYAQQRYITQVEGQRRTEAIIKLDAPTYVSYVEVYPASRLIPNFAMMTTTDDPPRFDVAFERVSDKQHQDIEGHESGAVSHRARSALSTNECRRNRGQTEFHPNCKLRC